MANIVKQIAIYKDNNWSTKDIGVDVDKVFLKNKTLGVETGLSLDQILNKFPEGNFSAGLLAADNSGKLISTQISPTDFNNLKNSINILEDDIENLKDNTWVNKLISNQLNNYNPSVGSSLYTTIKNIVITELTNGGYAPLETDVTETLRHFIALISNTLYPTGAIYITTEKDFKPAQILGGSWKRLSNKFLVDIDENDPNYIPFGPGKVTVKPIVTATSSTITIAKHSYTPSGNIDSNIVPFYKETLDQGTQISKNFQNRLIGTSANLQEINITFNGNSQDLVHESVKPTITVQTEEINVIPPYQKVYIWQRIDTVEAQDMYVISGQNWNTQDFLLSRETIDKWNEIKNYSPTEGEV